MLISPEGRKRPADAVRNAVKVLLTAAEEEPENFGSVPEKK